jgi:ribosomal subunit interface protein
MRCFVVSVLASTASALQLGAKPSGRLAVTGVNVELTDSLRNYADTKMAKAIDRHEPILTAVNLHLKVDKHAVHDTAHHGHESHVAECTALCKDRHVVRVVMESDSMYASIDLLSEKLVRALRKYKERKMETKRGKSRAGSEVEAVSVFEEDAEDEYSAAAEFAAAASTVMVVGPEDEIPDEWAFAVPDGTDSA